MTFPRDAWILRRLLADLPLNGELDTMTGALKSMAGHLAEIPLEGRQPAWDTILAVTSDRDELIKALGRKQGRG